MAICEAFGVLGPALVLVVLIDVAGQGRARAVATDAVATVDSLRWMAGSWAGAVNGIAMEEHWTAPSGGTLVGMHRDVSNGRTASFEFLRIEVQDGRLVYLASPRGAPPTAFAAAEVGHQRIVFENKTHDFPQRVLYWREGARLCARIEGTLKGKTSAEEWRWSPASLAAGGHDRLGASRAVSHVDDPAQCAGSVAPDGALFFPLGAWPWTRRVPVTRPVAQSRQSAMMS